MTEQEKRAIKWMQNVRDDAIVTLDHIAKEEPNVSPMLYAGRKEKAETLINGFEELEQYRAIGTVNEFRALKENWLNKFDSLIEYRKIGTVEECREAVEKQRAKKPIDRCMFSECPNCGNVEIQYCTYCPDCGQKLDWGGVKRAK